MEKYFGCDSHQRYSVFVTMDEKGRSRGYPFSDAGKTVGLSSMHRSHWSSGLAK